MNHSLQFPSLGRFTQLSHCLTTRNFPHDVTKPPGQKNFLKFFGNSRSSLVLPHQTHSSEIQVIMSDHQFPLDKQIVGDGLMTQQKNIWIGILVADCFPILYFDPVQAIIAVVHAGWRGIDQDIHLKTLLYMSDTMNSSLNTLRIGIGPGIGSCCFKVGKEVSEKFRQRTFSSQYVKTLSEHKDTIDLRGILIAEFQETGIPIEHIEYMDFCTVCRSDLFYSYRKEGKSTGRFMLAARLNPGSIEKSDRMI